MNQYNEISTLQYMGSKTRIISHICEPIIKNKSIKTVVDLFAGTGSVGYALKAHKNIISNDLEYYAYIINHAILNGCDFSVTDEISFWNAVEQQSASLQAKVCTAVTTENKFFIDTVDYKQYQLFCEKTPSVFMPQSDDPRLKEILDLVDTAYQNLFSKRQQIALMTLKNAIAELPEGTRTFFEDTLISIAHCGKYTDYRSKSQDNHCPENRLKETNLYHRFLEKLKERKEYIAAQNFDLNQLEVNSMDYRRFLRAIPPNTVNLLLTDPPYGDNAQYFEHAQRVHPLMNYSLSADNDRLHNEVVISNAPSRTDKHGKEQFLVDIERLFIEANRIVDDHGFMVLYFRPQQRDWVSDLNKLKDFGRRHGFEPLLTISAGIADPSTRALASAAWTFKNDVCFIFLKLQECERRWYEGEVDIDELVFLAATSAATDQGNPFVITRFNQEFQSQLRRTGLMRLAHPMYEDKIRRTLDRFTTRNGAQYRLTGLSPYTLMNREMNAEIRLREFAPVVIEELTANGEGFTFEEYVIHLASYMENGSREIINQLHTANRLIPELLNVYAVEDPERGKFFARTTVNTKRDVNGREHLCAMDPADFERLIADYFLRRGFVRAEVIGHSGDRGVDVLATNTQGELELIQCKRYRSGNNIGSTPIQRVDSYMRSRHASRAWVITTSDFTPDGRDEARITNVIIMNGQDLLQSLELYYPGRFCL